MTGDYFSWLVYALPFMMIGLVYYFRQRTHKHNKKILHKNVKAGMADPASLHPLINSHMCVGCGACVSACPEGDVLGLIHGRAELINPTYCIGHGACRVACPFNAISLVFGTATRGVDIPLVSETFETNIPGIFIAGELGGMGLIRNAAEQGKQAIDAISKLSGIGKNKDLDVMIIGAGPAGFSASLSAMEKKLNYVTVEQESLGGAVFQYPRGKIVMTAPVKLALVGKVQLRETSKEALLQMWHSIEEKTKVKINYREKMDNITPDGDHFIVTTTKSKYRTRAVLLTIGRRGTPRKLGVPGEELPKVVYSLLDPEQFRDKHVLVVGGGDSALEAAISIAEEKNTTVALSYRSEAFSRVKEKNRVKLASAEKSGRIKVLLSSTVKHISPDKVSLEHLGKPLELKNDGVIVCAGGILPTPFLKQIGIQVDTKYGTA
ncbi:MAG: NAD(P)-binding domain-containing protein [Gammaproteobacteria bacterium]|nr:NAD(P)-binding domain-containing protein [Gammaproteobacteria bacterium]